MTIRYTGEMGDGQRISIESEGTQTHITLAHTSIGQQQSQSSGFTTGEWTVPPTLFRTSRGLVLRVEGAQGQFFVAVQEGQTRRLETPPPLANAEVVPLQQASTGGTEPLHAARDTEPLHTSMKPMEPMKPIEPMKPMKPMRSMEMRMGAMQMQMGTMDNDADAEPEKRFCGQCGHAAADADRFCTRCGQRLT